MYYFHWCRNNTASLVEVAMQRQREKVSIEHIFTRRSFASRQRGNAQQRPAQNFSSRVKAKLPLSACVRPPQTLWSASGFGFLGVLIVCSCSFSLLLRLRWFVTRCLRSLRHYMEERRRLETTACDSAGTEIWTFFLRF